MSLAPPTSLQALLTSYFDAANQAEIVAVEDQVVAVSSGVLCSYFRPLSIPPDEQADDETRWLARSGTDPDGLRAPPLFGPLGSALRGERLAHIEFVTPIPHPLVSDASLRIVPVLPPALRPPVFADGVWGSPPIDFLYRQISHFEAWLRAMVQIGEDPWRDLHEGRLKEAYDALRAFFDGWKSRTWSAWSSPREPALEGLLELRGERVSVATTEPVWPWSELQCDGDGPWDRCADDLQVIRFVNREILALNFPELIALVRWRSREIEHVVPIPHTAELLAVDARARAAILGDAPTGRRMSPRELMRLGLRAVQKRNPHITFPPMEECYVDHPDDAPETQRHVFTLDLREGCWGVPLDLPAVWLEGTYLVSNDGRNACLDHLDPLGVELTPDRRFLWVEDNLGESRIHRTRDVATVEVPYAYSDLQDDIDETPMLEDDGSVSPKDMSEGWYPDTDFEDGPCASAVTRRADGDWLTLRHNLVARGSRRLFMLGIHPRVAAFDQEGVHLALADRNALRIIAISEAGIPQQQAVWPIEQILRQIGERP